MATESEASFLTFLMKQFQQRVYRLQLFCLHALELLGSLAIAATAVVGAGGVAHAVEWWGSPEQW